MTGSCGLAPIVGKLVLLRNLGKPNFWTMASRLPNRVSDGFTSLEGGVNSGRSPDIINQNQCAWAENVRFRGGYADQRPGFKSINFLEINNSGAEGYPGTLHTTFSTLFFQGSAFYDNGSASGQLIAVASGRVFALTPMGAGKWRINEMTDGTALLSDKRSAVYFQQADRYMVIQDGLNPPVIIEGSDIRQSDLQHKEVPIGSGPMAYGLGRLWVARGREFVAGDIVGGDTGVLKFTENDYLNEGGAFSVPIAAGPVTGMTFTSTLDTSLGQGELLVFTQSSVFSVSVPIDRDQWKNLNYPAQRLTIANAGGTSHRSIVNINSDTFFQSKDGLRSIIQGQRQYGVWANTPLSKEINRIIERDSHLFQPLSSAILLRNRMLVLMSGKAQQWPAVSKYVVDDDGNQVIDENGNYLVEVAGNNAATVHQPASFESIASLDFDPISSFAQAQAQPAYDGVWTKSGYRMLQLVSGRFFGQDRGFVWAVKESDRTVELLEITQDDSFDKDTSNNETQISSYIETRAYNFQQNRQLKRLDSADLWVDKLAGSVTFDLDFRPDQYPCWFDWIAFVEAAKDRQCDADIGDTCSWVTYQPQYRPRIRIPQPNPTDEAGAVKPSIMGYEFQAKLSWTGKARLKALRINSLVVPEDVYGDAPTASPIEQSITCCP